MKKIFVLGLVGMLLSSSITASAFDLSRTTPSPYSSGLGYVPETLDAAGADYEVNYGAPDEKAWQANFLDCNSILYDSYAKEYYLTEDIWNGVVPNVITETIDGEHLAYRNAFRGKDLSVERVIPYLLPLHTVTYNGVNYDSFYNDDTLFSLAYIKTTEYRDDFEGYAPYGGDYHTGILQTLMLTKKDDSTIYAGDTFDINDYAVTESYDWLGVADSPLTNENVQFYLLDKDLNVTDTYSEGANLVVAMCWPTREFHELNRLVVTYMPRIDSVVIPELKYPKNIDDYEWGGQTVTTIPLTKIFYAEPAVEESVPAPTEPVEPETVEPTPEPETEPIPESSTEPTSEPESVKPAAEPALELIIEPVIPDEPTPEPDFNYIPIVTVTAVAASGLYFLYYRKKYIRLNGILTDITNKIFESYISDNDKADKENPLTWQEMADKSKSISIFIDSLKNSGYMTKVPANGHMYIMALDENGEEIRRDIEMNETKLYETLIEMENYIPFTLYITDKNYKSVVEIKF